MFYLAPIRRQAESDAVSDNERMMQKTEDESGKVRRPRQARSQKRVAAILEAAASLIREKGCAGLTMKETAAAAGVTMGSMYQYFPNKSAVIEALCEACLEADREGVEAVFQSPPRDLEELSHLTAELLEERYRLHRDEPALADIRAWCAIDKEIQRVDHDGARRNVDIIFDRCGHLFDPSRLDEARQTMALILSYGGASVTAALHADSPSKSRRIMELAKKLLYATYDACVKPLAAKDGVQGP